MSEQDRAVRNTGAQSHPYMQGTLGAVQNTRAMTWDTLWSSTNTDKETDAWSTPDDLFETLHKEFNFTLDACANSQNAKLPVYIDKGVDALKVRWKTHDYHHRAIWCNPPYGRGMDQWLAKAWEACRDGATVVMLIFARTDTQWWSEYATKATEWRFVRGRLKFYKPGTKEVGHAAPAPSVVLVFRPGCEKRKLKVSMVDRKGDSI
jgi:phage N-6-adenine-methyltransferase